MTLRMEALKTFSSVEGFFKKGETFNAKDYNRAKTLSKKGLAKMIDDSGEMQTLDIPQLKKGESWGITFLGGGWYLLPNEERVQGFEKAQKSLLEILHTSFCESSSEEASENEKEMQLIPTIDALNLTSMNLDESLQRQFDKHVRHLGEDWYELPNGERVQGKESARSIFEAYQREKGGANT